MIPYARQDIDETDIAAVMAVLKGDWLTQGPKVPEFEAALSATCGARFAVAVNSATSALHVACLALGVAPGKLVWTVPNTFVASANCALYCGAAVDFVDIDATTWCMSVESLSRKLGDAKRCGRSLPDVVIPVHFGGQSCDMAAIADLADHYGFRLIEDASHALGGAFNGRPVGSVEWSDIAVFSFHPAKIATSGEGGAALTNNPDLARSMASLRTHGITRDANQMTRADEGLWYYEQHDLGFNYRLTDIAAALGLSQIRRLREFVAARNKIAQIYDAAFQGLDLGIQQVPSNIVSARHLYLIRVAAERRSLLFNALRARGIGVNVHYIPVHLQPYYRRMGFRDGQFPEAERHYREAITLPMYSTLSGNEQGQVISAVNEVVKCA